MKEEELQKLIAEVARRELREDESTKRQALEQFRDWIEKNPDIRDCRTDDMYLLRFLRKGKFSVPKAQEIFLKYANFCENHAHFARRSDYMEPKILMLFKNGYLYVSPFRSDEGITVVVQNVARFDPAACVSADYGAAIMLCTSMGMEDHPGQVLGVHIIINVSGWGPKQAAHLNVPDVLSYMMAVQKTIPLRYKGLHFINMHPFFKLVFDLVLASVSTKMAERIFVHSSMDELYQHVDRKLLPKELGGDMSEADMIAVWLKELEDKREMLVRSDSLRLVQLQDLKTNIATLPGSFRKLDVD